MKVAIIGTTAWGTTLGIMLARRGLDVALWARTKEEADTLDGARENTARLPGIPFPAKLSPTSSIGEALKGVSLVILAVPSQHMRHNARLIKPHINMGAPILSAAKGLERDSAKRMTQVIAEELDPAYHRNICVLSGPNLSKEIARGLPASTVVASNDPHLAEGLQRIMSSPSFQIHTSDDPIGVELGGALKNIIALGAGMVDALGYGNNAKAAYMAHGLTEIVGLGVALGANPITFIGLACLGDLLATCSSPLSRNRTLGEELAKGRSIKEILVSMGSVAEGVPTTAAALKLARQLGLDMPITERIYRVLFDGLDPAQAMAQLIGGQGV